MHFYYYQQEPGQCAGNGQRQGLGAGAGGRQGAKRTFLKHSLGHLTSLPYQRPQKPLKMNSTLLTLLRLL